MIFSETGFHFSDHALGRRAQQQRRMRGHRKLSDMRKNPLGAPLEFEWLATLLRKWNA
jgi:hypothetical protein